MKRNSTKNYSEEKPHKDGKIQYLKRKQEEKEDLKQLRDAYKHGEVGYVNLDEGTHASDD